MKRFVQVAAAACVAVLGFAGHAAAQPQGDRPFSVQLDGGVALGSQTSGAFGLEADYALNEKLAVFAEVSMISNVTPKFITDRANVVATALGGTADTKDKATFGTIGAKYTLLAVDAPYRPYVGVGFTYGKIAKTTSVTVGGAAADEAQLLSTYGVQLGSDLAGSLSKAGIGVVVGVTRSIGERLGVDLSYRFNRFMPKTSEIEDDQAINAQRVAIGVLFRF